MSERPISDVNEIIDTGIKQEVESLTNSYAEVNELVEKSDEISSLDSYLDYSSKELIEHLKRARQWEQKLTAHQRGLLNNSQVVEEIDDDKFSIEAQIERTDGYMRSAIQTLEQIKDKIEDESELSQQMADLIEELTTQQQRLHDLNDTLSKVDNDVTDAGILWME